MKIKMLATEKGSLDGCTVTVFNEGEEYDVPDALANTFVESLEVAELIEGDDMSDADKAAVDSGDKAASDVDKAASDTDEKAAAVKDSGKTAVASEDTAKKAVDTKTTTAVKK